MHSLHPGLILILTGLLAFALPQRARQIVSLAGPVLALGALLLLDAGSVMEFHFAGGITMELLHVDMLAKAFGLIFCIIAVIAGIYSFDVITIKSFPVVNGQFQHVPLKYVEELIESHKR